MARPHTTTLTDDRVRQLWAWHHDGVANWRIARRLNVSRQTVCNVLHGRSFASVIVEVREVA